MKEMGNTVELNSTNSVMDKIQLENAQLQTKKQSASRDSKIQENMERSSFFTVVFMFFYLFLFCRMIQIFCYCYFCREKTSLHILYTERHQQRCTPSSTIRWLLLTNQRSHQPTKDHFSQAQRSKGENPNYGLRKRYTILYSSVLGPLRNSLSTSVQA